MKKKVAEPLITEAVWRRLYADVDTNYGLRYHPGPAPTAAVSGDRYGLTDERYDPTAFRPKKYPAPAIDDYNAALAATVDLAVGNALSWLALDNNLTLRRTFDKIRAGGQLYLMKAPGRAARDDYGDAFASIGKRSMAVAEFLTRIPVVTPLDYEEYRLGLDQGWEASWKDAIIPHLKAGNRQRVADGITLMVGAKPGKYAVPPDWDDDPQKVLDSLDSLGEEGLSEEVLAKLLKKDK
jgi:hypothetical protein